MFPIGMSARTGISTRGLCVNLRCVHHVTTRALGAKNRRLLIYDDVKAMLQHSYDVTKLAQGARIYLINTVPYSESTPSILFIVLGTLYLDFCWTAQHRIHIKMLQKSYSFLSKTRIQVIPSDSLVVETQNEPRNGIGYCGVKTVKINGFSFRLEGHESSLTNKA